jgi:hypothetical protein
MNLKRENKKEKLQELHGMGLEMILKTRNKKR